ncbi:hypothetical protein P389DRAFT_45015 [Cystobasidium minutum MCA 4210]|uniref:uncharacterized protein n=1 Tax=Cystobasidium minutum MCA 4210 TaxID=1397322 RepID=UPI0034CE1D17|eukprot:jgi/Rhomi1/45015/CE45014_815
MTSSQSTRVYQWDRTPQRPVQRIEQQRDEGIIAQGMRTANLRPLRENKMDFSSPSRGELTPGRSLTDTTAQDEFRAHLEERVGSYQAKFPDELGIIISNNQKQKDELDLVLLEFRKLREGIISAGRADDFTVEVYETSAKLALLGRNIPQIASVLPHLVKTLHKNVPPIATKDDVAGLESGLKQLAISGRQAVPLDTKARFLSYYLLHLICHMEDVKAFQQVLKDTVAFDAGSTGFDKIPYSNKHITFVMRILHCSLHNDYAALSKITFSPRSYDKFAWVIVRSAQEAFRARAWHTLKSSYMSVTDKSWLAKQLQLDGEEELSLFLHKEQWDKKTDEKGAILLKKG